MNQKEKNYLIKRISEIAYDKEQALRKKFTTGEVSLTGEQRLAAFKRGAFQIKPEVRAFNRYTDIGNIVTFNAEKESVFDDKKYNKARTALRAYETHLKDEIMLGEAKEAVRLLEEFNKKQF